MIVRTYDDEDFRVHTVPLVGMSTVVVLTLALVISAKLGFFERQGVPDAIRAEHSVAMTDQRAIRFHDGADGTVWVADAATGEELARFGQNEGGFVRATARAMVHNRRQYKLGPEVPFDLIAWDNGSMTLRDSQTGRAVELASFGSRTHELYKEILVKGRK
ncbi:MAG: photosynthetic complex assembly protein PuhC [Erythrobacter sp.]|jgi:putative photosynthetic complex assembly protein|nr:photosynthetic complex assembly protein PuhC [Erythrobacter sp.]